MMRFDRFTERAQEAARRAVELMTHYGHSQVDVEHLLLALVNQPEGLVPELLTDLGVEPALLAEQLDGMYSLPEDLGERQCLDFDGLQFVTHSAGLPPGRAWPPGVRDRRSLRG